MSELKAPWIAVDLLANLKQGIKALTSLIDMDPPWLFAHPVQKLFGDEGAAEVQDTVHCRLNRLGDKRTILN